MSEEIVNHACPHYRCGGELRILENGVIALDPDVRGNVREGDLYTCRECSRLTLMGFGNSYPMNLRGLAAHVLHKELDELYDRTGKRFVGESP